jgi:hypothetical protein
VTNVVHKWKNTDYKRVIQVTIAAGIKGADYEVDPNTGKIRIITPKSDAAAPNPWDQAVADVPTETSASTRRKLPRK